jgi:hypothetical protein
MKYAIISDLHANLESLEAVLADMQPHAEAVICLGDIVGYNANPNECLALVQKVCDVVIAGNHDEAACDIRLYDDFSEYAKEAMHWTREQLTPAWKQYRVACQAPRYLAAVGSQRMALHAIRMNISFTSSTFRKPLPICMNTCLKYVGVSVVIRTCR